MVGVKTRKARYIRHASALSVYTLGCTWTICISRNTSIISKHFPLSAPVLECNIWFWLVFPIRINFISTIGVQNNSWYFIAKFHYKSNYLFMYVLQNIVHLFHLISRLLFKIQSTLDISKLWGPFFTNSNYPKCKLICTSGNLDL